MTGSAAPAARALIARALRRRADETGGYVAWRDLTELPLPDGTVERLVIRLSVCPLLTAQRPTHIID